MRKQEQQFSYIYIIGSTEGPVKIGRSYTPKQRVTQLSSATQKYILFGTWPVGYARAYAVERYVHWLLRDRQHQGEWFNVSRQEAAEAIERAISTDVDPNYPIPLADPKSKRLVGGDYVRTRLEKGVKDRLHRVSGGNQGQFIRDAVMAELDRRERHKP